jgi:DNA phosphorothioation-associated putative methyltransferase
MKTGWDSDRRLTAIGRRSLSVPARQAIADKVIAPGDQVLDYGCGRGDDVRTLKHLNVDAVGWDPYYNPSLKLEARDVVLLTYVLNVIEDPAERIRTLVDAWTLSTRLLVVSTRLSWERSKVRGQAHADGVVTSRNTFQHLYTTGELRAAVEGAIKSRCVPSAPGVIYAFRADSDRLAFLARRIVPETDWLGSEDATGAIAAVVAWLEQRGRLPHAEEIPGDLALHLAHLRSSEVARLAHRAADQAKVAISARRSTLNTLLLLGIELFHGRGPFSSLPLSVQCDVRAFFSSYKQACRRADRLLLKLRDDGYLRGAMYNSVVGKLTPTALYVHRRALAELPVVLRLYEHCAAVAAGRPQEWDLVKLHHQGRAVSYLQYPEFDVDPHPRLAASYHVELTSLDATFTSYADRTNRPLLHRKHEFLSADDPSAERYRQLTEAETKAGLYANPHLIGLEQGWQRELERCGRQLKGHRLLRIARS